MPDIRTQVRLPRDSGLPEDDVVNVFHFQDLDAATALAVATEVHTRVAAFYVAIKDMLGAILTGACNIKSYDMAVPEGERTPILSTTHAFVPNLSSLPAECAACVTMIGGGGAEGGGVDITHRRGRVYLGTLSTSLAQATVAGDLAIHTSERTLVLNAFDTLVAGGGITEPRMQVYSPTWHKGRPATSGGRPGGRGPLPEIPPHSLADSMFDVTEISMDDRLDTQRRRGAKATARQTKVIVPGAG